MERGDADVAPVDGAPPPSPTAAEQPGAESLKSPPKRKRQVCSPSEMDALRPPRLSPEPLDDPEMAKRVKEKNRLRVYRYNKAMEKRLSSDGGTHEAEALPAPESADDPPDAGLSRPVAVSGGLARPPKPQPNRAPASPTMAARDGDVDPLKQAPPTRGPPRLSPEPEGITPLEAKRIRAKNRLRVYRYRQAQKKLAGGGGTGDATAASPPSHSEPSEPEPDDVPPQHRDAPEANHRAFHRYQEEMPDYMRGAEFPGFGSLGQLDAATLAAMAQIGSAGGGGVMHHSLAQQHGFGHPAAGSHPQFPDAGPQADKEPAPPKKAAKVPKPPRMSPEPDDPKEAKRVRSKNRVRMHRYHQSLAAAQAAAEERPPAPTSLPPGLPMGAPHMPPYSSPYQLPAFAELSGRAGDWRALVEKQQQSMRLNSYLQDANMMMMRPNYRASDPGSIDSFQQPPPAKRQATAMKGKAPAANYPPPADDPSFPMSLNDVPFGNMTPVLRELALDTYIKETMGMANSLQQLEEQLKVAARHGDTGLQSTALLAAVTQLREDSLGLSRLRMQQYADLVQQSTSVVGKAIMKQKRRSAPGDVMP